MDFLPSATSAETWSRQRERSLLTKIRLQDYGAAGLPGGSESDRLTNPAFAPARGSPPPAACLRSQTKYPLNVCLHVYLDFEGTELASSHPRHLSRSLAISSVAAENWPQWAWPA